MKVFEKIELFHRRRGAFGEAVVSDEEFRGGLAEIINAVIPFRKDKERCISVYVETRDSLPLTASIAEKESFFKSDLAIGQKAVDLAVLEVIYEDRYSFGYLYWDLLSKYENELDGADRLVDPEAPYKKGLIEYAVEYDLTKTVDEYESYSSLDERYEYILGCLRRSQGEVLVKHQIKEDYEAGVSRLVEECKGDLADLDFALLEAGTRRESELPVVPASEEESNRRSVGDTPFAFSYVIDGKNRARLMDYLHARIDGKEKQYALAPIQAAINAGLLTMPSVGDFNEEFGMNVSHATYYDRIGPTGIGGFIQKEQLVKNLTEELKEMFK